MPVKQINGIDTYWCDWGETTNPHAMLIHCSLAHSGAWAGVAKELSDALYLQAFDLPGHGRSGEWDPAIDIVDQTISMALRLVEGKEIDLIGHSFGAVVCLRMALERPDLVRSLVLFEPVFFAAAKADGFDTDAPFANFSDAITANQPHEAARHFIKLWGAGERWEDIPEPQREALAARIHLIVAAEPALHKDNGGILDTGKLEALNVPVLFMQGTNSPPVVTAINKALAARLSNASAVSIPSAGHMGPVTHSQDVAREIRTHLKV